MDKRFSLKFIENIVEPFPLHKRTPLSDSHPEVAAYWHYEKNCGFGPEDFSAGSQVKAWWQCVVDETHIFQQTIKKRMVSERDGCPGHGCTFCRGLLPAANNWLANYPNLVSEWLTDRNGRAPEQIVAKSKFLAWWRCGLCASEWQTQVVNRTVKGSGCHYCAGYKVSEVNSLASLRPALVIEWLVRKNGNLTPDDVTTGSPREVWWQCKNDPSHIWTASIADRAVKNHGCRRCQRKTRRKLTASQLSKAKRLIGDGQLAHKVVDKFDVSREVLSLRLKYGYFED